MSDTRTLTDRTSRPCPRCATPIDSDPRFTDWCPGCEWNLGARPAKGRLRQRRRARDLARVERLYATLAAEDPAAGGDRGAAWVAAMLLATLVHLVTLAVLAGSVLLLVRGYPFLQGVGLVGLGLVWLLRPRLGRWRTDAAELTREQAPALHGLVDRVAEELGVRRPDRIRITDSYNASYARIGLRRRVSLTLGLPLWTALTGPERLALLGHELGHGRNGDVRRGFWLDLALRTLEAWYHVLRPNPGDARRLRTTRKRLLDELVTWLLLWIALPVRLAHRSLYRLTALSGQRAEYRADDLAARVGSSAAAAGMLDKLFLADSVRLRVAQQRSAGQVRRPTAGGAVEEEFWTGLAAYLESVPPAERARRARIGEREMTAVDTSHPPTHLRVRLRGERPAQAAAVTADRAEWQRIADELAPARRRVARALLGI
ncbi:M48 family metalloprotease [Kitasatospora sp. LaBMicrA B282]|uniref:M48 family metalloprotease n=1 Tax=Kitasatospora sp. LaBMicrA B282 TaxID=3420949 RepID=UPI003D0CB1A2